MQENRTLAGNFAARWNTASANLITLASIMARIMTIRTLIASFGVGLAFVFAGVFNTSFIEGFMIGKYQSPVTLFETTTSVFFILAFFLNAGDRSIPRESEDCPILCDHDITKSGWFDAENEFLNLEVNWKMEM